MCRLGSKWRCDPFCTEESIDQSAVLICGCAQQLPVTKRMQEFLITRGGIVDENGNTILNLLLQGVSETVPVWFPQGSNVHNIWYDYLYPPVGRSWHCTPGKQGRSAQDGPLRRQPFLVPSPSYPGGHGPHLQHTAIYTQHIQQATNIMLSIAIPNGYVAVNLKKNYSPSRFTN